MTIIILVAYWVIFFADLIFIWRLSRSNWRQHQWGRNVMAFTLILEVQIALILARTIFGEYPYRMQAITVCSCVFAVVVVNRLYIWIKGERAQARRNGGNGERVQVSASGMADDTGSDPGGADRG